MIDNSFPFNISQQLSKLLCSPAQFWWLMNIHEYKLSDWLLLGLELADGTPGGDRIYSLKFLCIYADPSRSKLAESERLLIRRVSPL